MKVSKMWVTSATVQLQSVAVSSCDEAGMAGGRARQQLGHRQPEHAEAVGHADAQVHGQGRRRRQPSVVAVAGDDAAARQKAAIRGGGGHFGVCPPYRTGPGREFPDRFHRLSQSRDARAGGGLEPLAAALQPGDDLRAHARRPELLQVIGDSRRRGRLVALGDEETADLVGHVDQSSGCVRSFGGLDRLDAHVAPAEPVIVLLPIGRAVGGRDLRRRSPCTRGSWSPSPNTRW